MEGQQVESKLILAGGGKELRKGGVKAWVKLACAYIQTIGPEQAFWYGGAAVRGLVSRISMGTSMLAYVGMWMVRGCGEGRALVFRACRWLSWI